MNHPRLWTAMIVAGVVVAGAVTGLYVFTDADIHARFLLNNPTGALSAADSVDQEDADLVFTTEQVEFLSEVSSGSLGYSFYAHERLFCLELSETEVVDVRLADTIEESDFHAITGGCRTDFGFTQSVGLAHTHPNYNDALSTQDKKVQNPPFAVTCIIYDEIREIRGEVHGLRCFDVPEEDGGSDREFPELELAIAE